MNERLAELVPHEPLVFGEYLGQHFVETSSGGILAVLTSLKEQLGFDFLVDLTAVDYPKREKRFDLLYILYNFGSNQRFRVKTQVSVSEHPASATSVFRAANWLEREVYDMFGIEFAGHPNLKRILLPEEWTGFPLRKDYSIIQQDVAWVQENLGIESGQ